MFFQRLSHIYPVDARSQLFFYLFELLILILPNVVGRHLVRQYAGSIWNKHKIDRHIIVCLRKRIYSLQIFLKILFIRCRDLLQKVFILSFPDAGRIPLSKQRFHGLIQKGERSLSGKTLLKICFVIFHIAAVQNCCYPQCWLMRLLISKNQVKKAEHGKHSKENKRRNLFRISLFLFCFLCLLHIKLLITLSKPLKPEIKQFMPGTCDDSCNT